MKRFLSLCLIAFCLILIKSHFVYAVGINMNLDENNISNENISNNSMNDLNTLTNNSVQSAAKVSTTKTSNDFHLSASDIIDIILISVGIVLIFLAIAILLKIK